MGDEKSNRKRTKFICLIFVFFSSSTLHCHAKLIEDRVVNSYEREREEGGRVDNNLKMILKFNQ